MSLKYTVFLGLPEDKQINTLDSHTHLGKDLWENYRHLDVRLQLNLN